MNAKKNLVLGLAKNYNWYILEPFVRSFIKNISNADMVLFVDGLSPFTLHMLKEVGKEFSGGELKLLPFDSDLYLGHPANTRWLAFRDFINEHSEEYSQVICADTRDVVFQTDIFKLFADKGEYFASAYYLKDLCIGKHFMSFFVPMIEVANDLFGEDKVAFLKDKPALCPSVFLGSAGEMKNFIGTLCDYVKEWDLFTADEAAFDYLIYSDIPKIKNRLDIDSVSGEIMHLNNLNNIFSIKAKDNVILNPAGTVPAIVHCYDRNVFITDFVDKIYRSSDFDFDENFSDGKSVMDQLPHLILAEKFDEALRIFVNYLFGKTDFSRIFNARDKARLENINLDALTEEDKKALTKLELKGDGDAFIRMWEIILQKNLPIKNSLEVLEIALQRSLMDAYDKILPLFRAEKICGCIRLAESQGHVVSLDFKKYVLEKLFERAKFFVNNIDAPRFYPIMFSVLGLIADLNLPLGEEWRLIRNKAYSRFSFLLPADEMQWSFYCPHRVDADFENGGIK